MKKSTIRKVVRTLILHINNSKNYQQIGGKKNSKKNW